ncbi:MAG: drug resistance transporter, EmrB/QacA subfamily [Candidatus Saccharibacteria bacterium]|nr:drug resistance transporter, EmrB/QacA subfamily [Candidatus Saccharibacteria bacterium]
MEDTEIAQLKSAHEHASGFTDKQKKIALTVVAAAFIMDLLDSTIVNIAIPAIQTNLHASFASIQWLVAGYLLAFATFLITGGRMGDVFGYKKIFMIGVGGFTVASLLSGLAWSPEILIFTRVLQGASAAMMVPQVMSMMQIMYKPSERGAINGLFGALGGLSASLGPVIGGLLIQANLFGLDWRPIFFINVPVGIVALILASRFLPEGKSPHPLKLDVIGTVLVVLTLSLLVYPLIQGRELNWPTWTFVMLASAIPVFLIFIWSQRRKDRKDGSALVQPSLFRVKSFGSGLTINLIFQIAMSGFFLTFGLFTQIGLGFSAIHAAVTGLPLAVGITFTMVVFGHSLIPKLGRRAIMIGAGGMATGLAVLIWLIFAIGVDINSWQIAPGLFIAGIGMGFLFGALYTAVLNGVDTKHAGSASGTLNAVQQVGGAIGIAIIGVIYFGQLSSGSAVHFDAVKPQIQSQLAAAHVPAATQTAIIDGTKTCFVDRSQEKDSTVVPASCKVLSNSPQTSSQLTTIITNGVRKANAINFQYAFRWAIVFEVIIIAATICLSFLLPKKFHHDDTVMGA